MYNFRKTQVTRLRDQTYIDSKIVTKSHKGLGHPKNKTRCSVNRFPDALLASCYTVEALSLLVGGTVVFVVPGFRVDSKQGASLAGVKKVVMGGISRDFQLLMSHGVHAAQLARTFGRIICGLEARVKVGMKIERWREETCLGGHGEVESAIFSFSKFESE
jgi:hypothetical protein